MKKLLIFLTLLCNTAFALEFQKYPVVLESSRGEQVIIVETLDKTQALIKVVGVNHPIDEVVFLTDLLPHGSIKAYKYIFDGQQRALVTREQGYACCSYALYLPDTRKAIYLSEQKGKRNKAISEDTYAQYKAQLADNIQADFAKFNREKAIANSLEALDKAQQRFTKQCGGKIETTINWQEIDDSLLQTYAIGAYCGQVANSLAKQCENSSEFKPVAQQFGKVECEFTDELKLRHTDSLIHFKTAPKAPNQAQFVEAYLRNL
ncbi:hypothetical protein [Pseudoalteromonas sp. ZZD1]|uniref:hypothetical protein n=1 Tax=Pseudoalteromonas sp. ZZD1 TaxID=3139395 RepID=UPI003BAD9584